MSAGFPGVDEDDIRLACEIDRFDFAVRAHSENGHIQLRAVRAGNG